DTLKLAGERGFIPMSLNLNPAYVGSHWESVEEGARKTGRTPYRGDWRMVREVFVAETDDAAFRLSAGDMMGRQMREYFLPLLAAFGFTEYLKHDPSVPDADVTPEYCARHNWLVGSPATVAEKLERVYHEVGGFGTLLVFCFDYAAKPEAWHTSMALLANAVLPRVKHLMPQKLACGSAPCARRGRPRGRGPPAMTDSPAERTGAEWVVEALRAEGVRHVFGIPGVHNLALYDALIRGGTGIPHVLARHEQGAAFM